MINNGFRVLINRLNSFCMVLIVMMHCVITIDVPGNNYFSNLVFSTFTRIAVPIFFIISGYLLFQHYNINKIATRTRTVFIPFLLWSIITLAIFYTLQHVSFLSTYFNNEYQLTAESILKHIFIKPLNGALWFLRDLYILVLISPLFFLVCKNKLCSEIILGGLFILWLIQPFKFFVESSLFFYLGSFMSLRRAKINASINVMILVYIFIGMCAIFPILYTTHNEQVLIKILITIGCVTIYFNKNLFLKDILINKYLDAFKKYSFFVYASHQIVCQFVKKVLLQVIPVYNIAVVIVIYLFTTIITIAICCLAQTILLRLSPKGVMLLTGNRC